MHEKSAWKRFVLLSVVSVATVSLGVSGLSAQDVGDLFEGLERPWLSSAILRESNRESELGDEEEHLETDRDSFAPATTTVRSGQTIFESAYSFIDNRSAADNHSFPEIITRVGLTKRLELRLGWSSEIGGGGSVSSGDAGGESEVTESRQESQMLYGFKYGLTQQQQWIPQSACIIQATTPTAGPETNSDLQLGYVFGWKIFNDWQLDSSLRYVSTKQEEDHFNQWAPSVVLKVPVADRWNVHGEYFGIMTTDRATNTNAQYISPGAHYLLTPDCEVGVRVGWGLNHDAASFFTNVGVGLRF